MIKKMGICFVICFLMIAAAVASKAYIKRYQHRNGHRVPAVVTGESRFVYKDVYTYYVDIGESNLVYLKKQNLYLVNRIMS